MVVNEEQYQNSYTTLLNGAIDNDDTTLVVDDTTTMTGNFRVKIDDEIILVGSVSGTTWSSCTRGVEGTSAASHSDNAPVAHVLTAAALKNVSGLILLETQTASSSSAITFTNIDDTYDEYELHYALIPVGDNTSLQLRLSSNGGSSYDSGASDYRYVEGRQRDGSAAAFDVITRSSGATTIQLANNIGSDTGEGIAGMINLPTLRDTTLRKMVRFESVNMSDVAEVAWHKGAGVRVSSSAFNGIQLYFNGTNIESGWGRLYGYRKI